MKIITIGRSQENDITVNDERVSRNHLQIVQDDNGNVSAVDLSSTNGTFINSNRIQGSVPLQPDDTVKIGHTILPWQSYVMAQQQPQQPPVQQPTNQPTPVIDTPKPKRTVWYIAATVAALLLIGGGIIWYVKLDTEVAVKTESVEKLQQLDRKKEQEKQQLEEEKDAKIRKEQAAKEAANEKADEAEKAKQEQIDKQKKAIDLMK
jgi:hypothetical protein